MQIPFQGNKISIFYDSKTYAPSSHTTLLFINTVHITSSDQIGAVIGTGSGLDAIALALKGLKMIIASDIDSHSLSISKQNAEVNHVEEKIEFRKGSMFEPLEEYKKKGNGFDILYTSPPCMPVSPDQIDQFPSYVNGGPDGTYYLEMALKMAPDYLHKKRGRLYLNFGSTTNPQKLFKLLSMYYNWKELARIHLTFSEQFLSIWPYLEKLKKQGKAEFWEEHGVPFRWYTQIEARPKL